MSYALALVRSLLFWPAFVLSGTIWSLSGAVMMVVYRPAGMAIVRLWSWSNRTLCRVILNQRVVVEGVLPAGPCLLVFKHETAFETIDMPYLLNRPAIFAKAELLRVPVWGWVARRFGLVPVERDNGPKAMRAMLTAARAMLAEGRQLCLFAEGTRVPPGAMPPLRAGFAGLYGLLKVDVVPVAVRSGHVHVARKWVKWPGVITYRVGAVVPAGLPRDEAEARVHTAINAFNLEKALDAPRV